MSPTGKIRIGAGAVIAGELFGLATMQWPRASTFVSFIFVAGALIVAGAALGTWGILEHGERG